MDRLAVENMIKLNKIGGDYALTKSISDNTGLSEIELVTTMASLIDKLSKQLINKTAEVNQLRAKIDILEADNKKLLDNSKTSSYDLQVNRLASGVKLARKNIVSKEVILNLQDRGMSIPQICEMLNVSRATVWRRLKEE